MKFEGEYIGHGNLSVVFRVTDHCLKIYRSAVGTEIPKKELSLCKTMHDSGLSVPAPFGLEKVEFDSASLDQILEPTLRREFRRSISYTAFRKSYIPGEIMGRRRFGSTKAWHNYLALNEAIFTLGLTPYDFIPHNYIVTPDKDVFLIDFDKVRTLVDIRDERADMRSVPNNNFQRAIFDVKRWFFEGIRKCVFLDPDLW